MPKYATDYAYIVYRTCDNEKWFYGAYNDIDKAVKVAIEINGDVIKQ